MIIARYSNQEYVTIILGIVNMYEIIAQAHYFMADYFGELSF